MFPRRTKFLAILAEAERKQRAAGGEDEFAEMLEHLAESERQNEKREESSECPC